MFSVKLFVTFCLSVVVSAQFPAHTNYGGYQKPFVPIVSQDFQIAPDGSGYQFHYASADGSQRQESGSQKGPESYSVTGSFSYGLPNGGPVQVNYVSDEFGYQPSGPGVHPDIAKAVAEQVAEARASPHSGGFNGGYRPVYG
ncbi:Endocuticle structural glycoprotein SgAbd-9, putative [Pediculus humanus corporis]|uniref:Endocuticle structural glycoprotein SgAbd-9, putative n=1 Tax=Pediculus humanus subsp. corporis TaxID=121224 RepID=E0VR56_PEDHC|nr:Endocuticle structural glycoprotein SgAbd-9, putative [Pediculus humanus corporis]EEB15862.1 Endocuticle structural glycoprotein SgAbd-9, putative [Pediculus humanus corporis]